jgi:hypothetical protein
VYLLPLKFNKCIFAVISNPHAGWCIGLEIYSELITSITCCQIKTQFLSIKKSVLLRLITNGFKQQRVSSSLPQKIKSFTNKIEKRGQILPDNIVG